MKIDEDDIMLVTISGDPDSRAQNLNRLADVEENIMAIRAEFIGKPEICHVLARHIVYLRRGIDIPYNSKEFFRLLVKYINVLCDHYDTRWLISICDTIADLGTEAQSARAMLIVNLVQCCNIANTVIHKVVDGRLNAQLLQSDIKWTTWDGLITADTYQGDMIYNMVQRCNRCIKGDPILRKIWSEIKQRAKHEQKLVNNVLLMHHEDPRMRTFFV